MCLILEMNFNLWSFAESAYWQSAPHCSGYSILVTRHTVVTPPGQQRSRAPPSNIDLIKVSQTRNLQFK